MLMRMLQTQLKKEFRDLRFSDWNVEKPFSDYWEKQVLRKQSYIVFFNLKLQFVLILTSNFDVFWKVKLPRWIKVAFPLTESCHSSDSAVGMHKSKVEYPSQRSICCLLKRLKACTFSFFCTTGVQAVCLFEQSVCEWSNSQESFYHPQYIKLPLNAFVPFLGINYKKNCSSPNLLSTFMMCIFLTGSCFAMCARRSVTNDNRRVPPHSEGRGLQPHNDAISEAETQEQKTQKGTEGDCAPPSDPGSDRLARGWTSRKVGESQGAHTPSNTVSFFCIYKCPYVHYCGRKKY